MNISDFFKEMIAPHVKNIEAEHYHDIPNLDILSSIVITEKDNGIEIDARNSPLSISSKLNQLISERTKFLNFEIKMVK